MIFKLPYFFLHELFALLFSVTLTFHFTIFRSVSQEKEEQFTLFFYHFTIEKESFDSSLIGHNVDRSFVILSNENIQNVVIAFFFQFS